MRCIHVVHSAAKQQRAAPQQQRRKERNEGTKERKRERERERKQTPRGSATRFRLSIQVPKSRPQICHIQAGPKPHPEICHMANPYPGPQTTS
jgi:hypothetical protein